MIRLLCCSGSMEGGGSERQLCHLVNGIDADQFQASLYLLYRRGVFLPRVPKNCPITDFWTDHKDRRYLPGRIHAAQVRHLTAALRQQRIQVVYDRTFHMTLITAPACKRAKVPRASVIVSPPSQDFVRSHDRFKFMKKWLLSAAYRDPAAMTIAVSQHVAEDATQFYGLNPKRVRIVPSPVDIAEIRAKAMVDTEWLAGTRICVVGRMSQEKGQRSAIEAMARWKNRPESVSLDLVGDGPDRAELETLAKDLGLMQTVRFHGYLENPFPIVKRADILLIPSDYEGLPNVMLEAMALGTTVVASECSRTVTEILRGPPGGAARGKVYAVGDSAALVSTLQLLAGNDGLSRSLASEAEAYVNAHHSMEHWLRTMEGHFRQLVGSQGSVQAEGEDQHAVQRWEGKSP